VRRKQPLSYSRSDRGSRLNPIALFGFVPASSGAAYPAEDRKEAAHHPQEFFGKLLSTGIRRKYQAPRSALSSSGKWWPLDCVKRFRRVTRQPGIPGCPAFIWPAAAESGSSFAETVSFSTHDPSRSRRSSSMRARIVLKSSAERGRVVMVPPVCFFDRTYHWNGGLNGYTRQATGDRSAANQAPDPRSEKKRAAPAAHALRSLMF
jgi:hypothetical protein